MQVPGWLCHTQGTERAIRLVDRAAKQVVDPQMIDARQCCNKYSFKTSLSYLFRFEMEWRT